jgi:hypothetical protein
MKAPAATTQEKLYPAGFAVQRRLEAASYHAPGTGQPMMAWTSANLQCAGGNLSEPKVWPVTWVNGLLQVTGGPALRPILKVTPATGLWQVSFLDPATGQALLAQGAFLQGPGYGAGWFLGSDQSGFVLLR